MSADRHPSAHDRYLAAVRRVQELEAAEAQAPAKADSLEDSLVKALERDRIAQMSPAQRHAAELDAAKAKLAAGVAGLTFEDMEAPPRDWDPSDWEAPEDTREPEVGMVSILDKLGMLK